MSKAFTKESDDMPDHPSFTRRATALPTGAQNLITPDGARQFRRELERLVTVQRPLLAARPDDNAKSQLQELDRRIQWLSQSLESAVVTPPTADSQDVVAFGANVLVRDESGEEIEYRIVGLDEVDIDNGWVSWMSPIARTLMNARVGERVKFAFPSGEEELEIVDISYNEQ